MIWDEKEELWVSGGQEKTVFQEGRQYFRKARMLGGKNEDRELTILFGKLEVVSDSLYKPFQQNTQIGERVRREWEARMWRQQL